MRKIAKILLCISCLLPLTCLVAFAEEVRLPDGSFVDVTPYYGVDAVGCPLDAYGYPDKSYYDVFYSQSSVVVDNSTHVDEIYVPGFVYEHDIQDKRITYSGSTFHFADVPGVDVGDVIVAFTDDDGYMIFDVDSKSLGQTYLLPRGEYPLATIEPDYSLQLYKAIDPLNFVSLIGDWITGCFGTVAVVLTDFATDNEWITLFLLVIPLSGLIFSFVKSLIARR